jgi:hypothetical protein
METNMIKGECGDCGHDEVKIFKRKDVDDSLITECTKCKTLSVITLSKPELQIKFHPDSTGRLHFHNEL